MWYTPWTSQDQKTETLEIVISTSFVSYLNKLHMLEIPPEGYSMSSTFCGFS